MYKSFLAGRVHACAPFESNKQLKLYFALLTSELGLDHISWAAAYRGRFGQTNSEERKLLDQWLMFDLVTHGEDYDPYKEKTNYLVTAAHQEQIDPLTRAFIDSVGTTRTLMFFDFHSFEDLEHWSIKVHESFDVQDRMLGVFSFGEYGESVILADRRSRNNRFTSSDRKILLELIQAFPRVHYWLMLERGLLTPTTNPLNGSERKVLQKILHGHSDKNIARLLELEVSTVRSYISTIYRKLDVSSRAGLTMLWHRNLDEFFDLTNSENDPTNTLAFDLDGNIDLKYR